MAWSLLREERRQAAARGFRQVKKAVEIVANYDLPNLAMESVLPGVGEKRKKKGGKK